MHSNLTHHNARHRRATVYAPRQDRSRATRDRILAALVRLLDGRAFDHVTVAELTAAARCSISSFYARFPTKDSLFSALLDRFFDTSAQLVDAALSRISAAGATAEGRTRALVAFLLHSYRQHRGLLRALVLHDRQHPGSGFGTRTLAHKRETSAAMFAMLLGDALRDVGEHDIDALRFALWLVVQAIEQIVLFENPTAGRGRVSDALIVDELTAVLYRKLPQWRVGRARRSPA